jgi:hypothetical protein
MENPMTSLLMHVLKREQELKKLKLLDIASSLAYEEVCNLIDLILKDYSLNKKPHLKLVK